jgi:hypothetical protein
LKLSEGKISAPEAAGLYILSYLQIREPKLWLSARFNKPLTPSEQILKIEPRSTQMTHLYNFQELEFNQKTRRRLDDASDAGHLITIKNVFANFSLRSVPKAVNHALIEWTAGNYDLVLVDRVPAPFEILKLQCEGKRCVSMLTKKEELEDLVIGQRDPLGFILHDLIHADRFYLNKDILPGQLGFCRLLKRALDFEIFSEMLLRDRDFEKELHYIAGDMNSFCVHLMKCLKAVTLAYFLRQELKPLNTHLSREGKEKYVQFFHLLLELWATPPDVALAIQRLNTPEEDNSKADNILIKNFFDKQSD